MYEYTCDEATGTRMICREDSHAKDYCQALAVSDKECTAESLRAIDPSLTDEEVAKGIEEGMANVAKFKGTTSGRASSSTTTTWATSCSARCT